MTASGEGGIRHNLVVLTRGEWFNYALVVGMTPDEYWFGDPGLLYNYAEKYKIERQIREDELWAAGAYVKAALQTTILMAGLADKKTANSMPKYPEKPSSQTNSNASLTPEQIELENKRAEAYFNTLMRVHNRK